jgi:hypothetical protein
LFADEHGASGPMRSSRARIESEHVRFVTKDVAIADWSYRFEGVITPEGPRHDPVADHVTVVARKSDGAWSAFAVRAYQEAALPKVEGVNK